MKKGITFNPIPGYEEYKIFFGDLHGHTADSFDVKLPDDGANPIDDGPGMALAYARDPAGGNLDFMAFTDHAEAFNIAENWSEADITRRYQEMLRLCAANDTADDIVIFPGFEYSNSQHPGAGNFGYGNKHIIFRHHSVAAPRPIPCPDTANKDGNIAQNIRQAWDELDGTKARGNYITVPHHPARGLLFEDGNTYFMASDWSERGVDAARMPLVEMYSLNGNSEMPEGEEPVKGIMEDYTVEVALGKWLQPPYNPAYQLGLIASTDNHLARPGYLDRLGNLPKPENRRQLYGGYAVVWATELSGNALWEGMQKKRTYATSGARIMLAISLSCGASRCIMGETMQLPAGLQEPIQLKIAAAPDPLALNSQETPTGIHHVEIFKQTINQVECLRIAPAAFDTIDEKTGAISLTWADANPTDERAIYRVKVFQNPTLAVEEMVKQGKWNEELYCLHHRAWSSPIWVEQAPASPGK